MGLPEECKDTVRTLRDSKLSVKSIISFLKTEELRLEMEKEEKRVKCYILKKQYHQQNHEQHIQQQNF